MIPFHKFIPKIGGINKGKVSSFIPQRYEMGFCRKIKKDNDHCLNGLVAKLNSPNIVLVSQV
jgi:hypothetical protein